MLDFIRIACAVPAVKVGDVEKNTRDICEYIEKADNAKADIVVFPELSMTGYTCQDLFFQDSIWQGVKKGLREIVACSSRHPGLTVLVGLPVCLGVNLYNCAAVICGGTVRGLVPKTFVPNYGEFYEKRWFTSAENVKDDSIDLSLFGLEGVASFDSTQVFQIGEGTLIGVEICEDMWTPLPPSSALAMRGAEVILNLSASDEVMGKRKLRRDMLKRQSSACNCIYAYCSSGSTESAQDMVFSGHSAIAENGVILKENAKQLDTDYMIVQDCDLGIIRHERRKNKSFADAGRVYDRITNAKIMQWNAEPLRADGTLYPVNKAPFVLGSGEDCLEAFAIQVEGLKQRLALLGAKPVVGISGGLDSTLALLVAVEAVRQLGRPVSDVHGITMPCFGTSDRTYQNALELMKILGITAKEINIRQAVSQHFADIGHDAAVHNGTYENTQARERTQVLMDYAGMVNGIVVGTGDLSELALGWCTYNGDHMSMYAVNASVPKTMIPHIIAAVSEGVFAEAKSVLQDIVDTPISPELLPPDESGKIAQVTEDLVGPYALHDFFLYHMFCHGFTPTKIYTLACHAFANEYDAETIKKWLKVFYRRFFTQQFKRNCVPDGVKVGRVGLSPRGDWRMPSDASANLWLDEVESL
ncbi:MAG: NAD(+) synthase [Oscillospiraceae bacterium]|nr:NAD(+) synthase [Oscillospiraceae bacterium]